MSTLRSHLMSCRNVNELRVLGGRPPLSPAWQTLGNAAAGMRPMPGERETLAKMTTQLWPDVWVKILEAIVGRGGWKTTWGGEWTLFHTLCVDHDPYAMPGSRVFHGVLAPSKRQAAEAVRMLAASLRRYQEALPGLAFDVRDARGDSTEIVILSPKGPCERVISVFSLESELARGFAWASLHVAEAGHMANEGARTLRSVLQAIVPRFAQFPKAQLLLESTMGPPEGVFYEYAQKPPPQSLVVTGSTFTFNPTISEAEARAWVPDPEQYAQEILSTRWGANGEGFLSGEAIDRCLDRSAEWTGKGPRNGYFALGVDLAQLRDQSAFVVVSAHDVEVSPRSAPVRHVVIEHIEAHQGSKASPLMLSALSARAVEIGRSFPSPYGTAAATSFDLHLAVEFSAQIERAGYRRVGDVRELGGGRFHQAAMNVPAQTARFRLLRELVNGGRLHVPDTKEGHALLAQLRGLRAWELPAGLKVEGKRDDVADALVLAIEAVTSMPATDGAIVREVIDRQYFDEEGLHIARRFVREVGGKQIPAEMPSHDPAWEAHVRTMLEQGIRTPGIDRWLASIGIDTSQAVIRPSVLDEARPLVRSR